MNTSSTFRRRARLSGFTLIEVMVVTGVMGILASIAYPSFQGVVLKARRVDAVTALMQTHLSQERWRGSNARYAQAQELRLPGRSPMGHYQLAVIEPHAHGVTLTATAVGAQAADGDCRVLTLVIDHGQISHRSGPDADTHNAAPLNRRCWNL